LLAVILGPSGGYALLLGDGLIRVDRKKNGEWESALTSLGSGGKGPSLVSSFALSAEEISIAMKPIAPKGATDMRVIVATDGVEKTPKNGLDPNDRSATPATLEKPGDCERYIHTLERRPDADEDNVSIAFSYWRASS
jgi:hypothetical protein